MVPLAPFLLAVAMFLTAAPGYGVAPLADPTPSPTLGSTESPNPNPPDDNDADGRDYSQPVLVVAGVGVAALVIVVTSVLWLRGRKGTPEDQLP